MTKYALPAVLSGSCNYYLYLHVHLYTYSGTYTNVCTVLYNVGPAWYLTLVKIRKFKAMLPYLQTANSLVSHEGSGLISLSILMCFVNLLHVHFPESCLVRTHPLLSSTLHLLRQHFLAATTHSPSLRIPLYSLRRSSLSTPTVPQTSSPQPQLQLALPLSFNSIGRHDIRFTCYVHPIWNTTLENTYNCSKYLCMWLTHNLTSLKAWIDKHKWFY